MRYMTGLGTIGSVAPLSASSDRRGIIHAFRAISEIRRRTRRRRKRHRRSADYHGPGCLSPSPAVMATTSLRGKSNASVTIWHCAWMK